MRDYKNEKINRNTKTSDIILNNHFMILVLERFEIELGLHDKTIEIVCEENNINTEVALTVLNLYNDNLFYLGDDFKQLDAKEIIRYLENSHRYYSEEVFPEIVHNIHLMSKYNNKPEILMVEEFFRNYKREVEQHLDYENKIVFPYILNLINKEGLENESDYSVSEYKEHHDDIEEKLDDLKKLLIQHLPPKDDHIIRRKILFALFDLEYDLIIHAKIENEILIPIVEVLENKKGSY